MNKFMGLCFCLLFSGALQVQAQPQLKNATAEDIMDIVSSFEGQKPVLVNYWATWCGPCREEFPYILQLKEKYGDQFELMLVSADFDEARTEAIEFLEEYEVDFTTYFKVGRDNEFIRTVSDNWTGALPYTVIYDRNGAVSSEWEDKADFDTFESELLKAIQKE